MLTIPIPSVGSLQTPWTSNINAAGYNLSGIGSLIFPVTPTTEQVVNGTFISDLTGWTLQPVGGSIVFDAGTIKINGDGNYVHFFQLLTGLTSGKTYQITYDKTASTVSNIVYARATIGTTLPISNSSYTGTILLQQCGGNGSASYSTTFVADATNYLVFQHGGMGSTYISFDNISIKELRSSAVTLSNNVDALELGDSTEGVNLTVFSTIRPTEMAPSLESANWTATDGWSAGGGVLTKIAGSGTGTITPSGTFTVIAGRSYQVTTVVSALSGSIWYSIGGQSGVYLSATTQTQRIYARTTGKIIFSGLPSSTATITSLTVKEILPSTGDLEIEGQLILPSGGPIAPAIIINPGPGQIGMYQSGSGFGFTTTAIAVGADVVWFDNESFHHLGPIDIGYYSDAYIQREAAGVLAHRHVTNGVLPQTLRIYTTASNNAQPYSSPGDNYERFAINTAIGNITLAAESAGDGSANINLILSPKGVGSVLLNGNTGIGLTPTVKLDVLSDVADGGSAIAMKVNTATSWSNQTSRLLTLRNNTTEKFAVFAPNGSIFIKNTTNTIAATFGGTGTYYGHILHPDSDKWSLGFSSSYTGSAAGATKVLTWTSESNVGIATIITPTARLHLPASTATVNTASMKIDPGVVATAPVSGNIESDGTHLYWTDSGGTRRQLDN